MISFPIMRADGTVIGQSTLETINNLLQRGMIEECYNPISGVIFYCPTMLGLRVMLEAQEK